MSGNTHVGSSLVSGNSRIDSYTDVPKELRSSDATSAEEDGFSVAREAAVKVAPCAFHMCQGLGSRVLGFRV